MNSPKVVRIILYTAALYNWQSALILIFYPIFMPLNNMSPLPNHPLWITMLGTVLATFGVGYFMAARNLVANLALLKIGIVGKTFVFFAVLYCTITVGDSLSMKLFYLEIIEIIYAALFLYIIVNIDAIEAHKTDS